MQNNVEIYELHIKIPYRYFWYKDVFSFFNAFVFLNISFKDNLHKILHFYSAFVPIICI